MSKYAAVDRTIAARHAFLKIDNRAQAQLGPYSVRTNAHLYEQWPGWARALKEYQDAIDVEQRLLGLPPLGGSGNSKNGTKNKKQRGVTVDA